MTTFALHVDRSERRLDHWQRHLNAVAEKGLVLAAPEQATLDAHLSHLRQKLEVAQRKLEALRSAGEQRWHAYKLDLELSFRDFEKSFRT